MPKHHQNFQRGFTLIELLLVLALTVFLLVAALASIINSTAQFAFINSYEKVLDMARMARSLAISGKVQLDYTDFDNDGCTDTDSKAGFCSAPDHVTPAHYGVHFEHSDLETVFDAVTLFADIHAKAGGPCLEGKYDPEPAAGKLKNGCDFILETYHLPKGIRLLDIPDPEKMITLFYAPIFADISFDAVAPPNDPFFRFGLEQKGLAVERKRCSQIHKLAGITEPSPTCP